MREGMSQNAFVNFYCLKNFVGYRTGICPPRSYVNQPFN
jgi:hypothetical protein